MFRNRQAMDGKQKTSPPIVEIELADLSKSSSTYDAMRGNRHNGRGNEFPSTNSSDTTASVAVRKTSDMQLASISDRTQQSGALARGDASSSNASITDTFTQTDKPQTRDASTQTLERMHYSYLPEQRVKDAALLQADCWRTS